MWKTLKGFVTSNKVSTGISEFIFENKKESDPIVIAERMNNYYIEIIENINKSIPAGKQDFVSSINLIEIFNNFIEISESVDK